MVLPILSITHLSFSFCLLIQVLSIIKPWYYHTSILFNWIRVAKNFTLQLLHNFSEFDLSSFSLFAYFYWAFLLIFCMDLFAIFALVQVEKEANKEITNKQHNKCRNEDHLIFYKNIKIFRMIKKSK